MDGELIDEKRRETWKETSFVFMSVKEARWGQVQSPTMRWRLFSSGWWDETSLELTPQARFFT